ncbi:VCBS domain-containing protein [Simiduia aestuariiviva]|uniref:VCBS domain-containing protein n=1 Tax=Simiduia aestuariiviva TaxID=1510459 RepID=UPI00248367EF|nr:VCBS domain-containing protein [Simiduia aestuariiviva]
MAAGETMTDTITFTSDDGTTETQTITITGANDAAAITVTATDTAVTEDDAGNNTASGTVSITDADTGEGSLASSTATYGSVTVDGSGNWTYALDNSNAAVQALAAGETMTDTITFTSDDGTTETQTITITGANDVSTIDLDGNNSSGATGSDYQTTYTEGGSAVRIADIDVSISDPDHTTLTSARIQISNVEAGDLLTIGALPAGITASAYDPSTGLITLSGNASLANYQQAIRAVQYSNDGSASGADKDIQVSVFDGTDWSNTAHTTIAMVLVPTVSVADVSVQEPQSGTTTLTFTINIDTPPASDLTFTYETVSGTATGGSDYVTAGPLTATIAAGSTSTTVTITVNSDSNVFEGDEDFYLNLSNFNQTVNFAPGSHLTADGVQAIGTIGANNGAPIAEDDTYITSEDQPLVTGNVLANDTLVDGAAISGYQTTTPNGGTVVYNNDGTFTYTPAAGYVGTDTFTYTLTDADGEFDTATVTIDVSNTVVEAPVVSGLADATYQENAAAYNLFNGISIADADSSNLSSVVVTIDGFLNSQDVMNYLTAGTNVNAVVSQTGTTWELTLSGGADIGEYITVLETITYLNSSENPSASTRTVTVEAFDESYANIFGSDSMALTVDPVNDAPTVFDNDRFVVEGTAGAPMNIQAPTDVDSDDANLLITVTGIPGATTGVVTYSDGVTAVNVGDVLTMAQLTTLLFQAGSTEAIDAFTYTVDDGELTTVGTTTLTVGSTQPDFNTVYESGLSNGSGVAGQSAVATGNLFDNDGSGGGLIDSIDFNGTPYTAVGGVITVTTPLGTLTVDANTGEYSYQLNSADNTGSDVQEQFTYNFTSGAALSDVLTITIVDDVPIASNVAQTIPESEEKIFNLMLTLDASGSMAWGATTGNNPPDAGEPTRMFLAKEALNALAAEYFNQSTQVTVTLISFANAANVVGTYTSLADFTAGLNTVNANGGTNYVNATTEIQNQLQADIDAQNPADNVQNISYFISDGEPNAGTSPEGSGYLEFVNSNSVQSYAVGIGSSLPSNLDALNYIHNIDSLGQGHGHVDSALHVPDLTQLESELLSTVPTAFGGNITQEGTITKVSMGADGGYVSSIEILLGDPAVLHTINYDGTNFTVSPALPGSLEVDGTKVTLNADDGFAYGTFTMDFATGSYLFIAPNGTAEVSFQFDYTVLDGDGDTASATAKFNIVDDKPDARDDLHTAGHYETMAGNVVTGLGTDGGPSLGAGFTPFAAQGGGVDKVVDDAKVTSFSYKGLDLTLDLAPVQQVTGQSESVTVTSQASINNSNFAITATRNGSPATLTFDTGGGDRGVGVTGDTDDEIDANEVMVITWDQSALPYGVTGLQLAMGNNFGNSDRAQVRLFDADGVELGGSPFTQFGTNDLLDLSAYEGVARIEISSTAGNGFTLQNIAYDPVMPSASEPSGSNGSGLSWVYDVDFDLEGNQVNEVTVTDANDGSTFVMRSNGFYQYTPDASVDLTPVSESFTDGSADQGVTASTTANGSPVITYNGANGIGVNSNNDQWDDSADGGDNIILTFDSARYAEGVEDITLYFGYDAGQGSVTFYDDANNVITTVALTGADSQTFSNLSGVRRIELTTAGNGDYSIQRVDFTPTAPAPIATAIAPQLVEYTLTDNDGQSDTAQLALYTIDNRIQGTAGNDNIIGGDLNDAIVGAAGNDTLTGGAGHDSISGGAGQDIIRGGTGNDYLAGGADNDELYGEEGDDHLAGDGGADLMDGGIGNDILIGGDGNDLLFGGADDDKLYGGEGNDQLYGGSGNDLLVGEAGDDLLNGGTGDDILYGGEDQDTLIGGEGNDTLFGGRGDDTLTGGNGSDTFAWVNGNIGTDVVTDFNQADGDILNLADLLIGEESGNIEDYLQFNFNNGNTYISIDTDAGATFDVSQIIVLQGVDITAGNTLTTQQIVDSLLSGGNLTIDS